MGRFLNGAYASRYGEAAMLGYVQSDSVGFWQSALKKAIEDGATSLALRRPQCDEVVIGGFPHEWASDHDRPVLGRPIGIYHILLDCTNIQQGQVENADVR
jgi:hypothetical protein